VKDIPDEEVVRHLGTENAWWRPPHLIPPNEDGLRPRAYLGPLRALVSEPGVHRAVLLMGPRRVGKTVLIRHVVRELIRAGVQPTRLCYVSVDHPLYTGRRLDELFDAYRRSVGLDRVSDGLFVFFDEIQYLRNWEVHLKSLVDEFPGVRFVASGSAAAALRLKSQESGAGRFTDFLLPPLTFGEYLDLVGGALEEAPPVDADGPPIVRLNERFVKYLNFGGYPEVALNPIVQADPGRFVKADIIDKVLLRDLPSLYGIQDVQELNALFTALAFNTAEEVSLEQLAQRSGVAKNTLKRYIDYLVAAFLLRVLHRVDRSARRFQRATAFKVYLTNPSMRAALFAPLAVDDEGMGKLVETAVCAHRFHQAGGLHYARWKNGEVDLVAVDARQHVSWALEVKWSDRAVDHPDELRSILRLASEHKLREVTMTTRTVTATREVGGIRVHFVPAAEYCLALGAAEGAPNP
jgi:hypothetical protein